MAPTHGGELMRREGAYEGSRKDRDDVGNLVEMGKESRRPLILGGGGGYPCRRYTGFLLTKEGLIYLHVRHWVTSDATLHDDFVSCPGASG